MEEPWSAPVVWQNTNSVSNLLPVPVTCTRLEYSSMRNKQQVFNKISIDWFLNYSSHWIIHTVELLFFFLSFFLRWSPEGVNSGEFHKKWYMDLCLHFVKSTFIIWLTTTAEKCCVKLTGQDKLVLCEWIEKHSKFLFS